MVRTVASEAMEGLVLDHHLQIRRLGLRLNASSAPMPAAGLI